LIPTGSQDPYALRRQAAGVVQMVNDHQLDVSLEQLIEMSLEVAEARKLFKREVEEIKTDLIEFFKLRVKTLLQDQGIQYDVIDAVLTDQIGHIPTLISKAVIISEMRQHSAFKKVVEALSRVTNIAKKAQGHGAINVDLFEKEEESQLYSHYKELKTYVEQALIEGDAQKAYEALASSEPFINKYFDHIMVMSENHEIA